MIAAATENVFPAVRAALPAEIELRSVPRGGEGLEEVELLVAGWFQPGLIEALPTLSRLRVLQALSAGTDHLEPVVPRHVTLCNARGARDAAVAEWCAGALLGAATRLLDAPRRTTWDDDVQPGEVAGSTVVVLGHGSIGRALEARLEPFGAHVIGVARTARDGLRAVDELDELLPRADALVVLAPLTDQTRGLLDARRLALLPDGALLVNAGRGAIVDTDALVAETTAAGDGTGPRLRAVLDVVDPEPLPAGHPLWTAPGVLAITPHHAGDSPQADARAARFAADQIVRYTRGEPLQNVVRRGA